VEFTRDSHDEEFKFHDLTSSLRSIAAVRCRFVWAHTVAGMCARQAFLFSEHGWPLSQAYGVVLDFNGPFEVTEGLRSVRI
jgi:hypothetical protein